MPLHLLPKKSWHVSSAANIARVRQDEADARAREEAADQRLQAEDAAYRTAVLRGENPAVPVLDSTSSLPHGTEDGGDVPRKRRRRVAGEDDTESEIRQAREVVEAGAQARVMARRTDDDDAPLVDEKGHLVLFAGPTEKTQSRKGQGEAAAKRQKDEDLANMRFSHAAGRHAGMQEPWYAAPTADAPPGAELLLADMQAKDVWGNADPRRQTREHKRLSSGDPFAAMQQAQSQLKQKDRDRGRWEREREVENEQLRREKRHRKRHREDADPLEGFSLDAPRRAEGEQHSHRKHHHRSRSREKHESRRQRSRV